MAVPSTMADLSVTAATNSPAGTESPTAGDDFLRAIQAIVRTTNAKGSDIASATTTDIGAATAEFVDVTGTTTITGLGTIGAGITRKVRFTGALLLTYNATSLILPGSANITTANGDTAIFVSLGSGNWVCINYTKRDGTAISPFIDSTPIVKGSGDATKLLRIEVDGLTTATTRVITMPDFDINIGITGNTEDTSPDYNADFTATYDNSAGVLKKVLLGRAGSFVLGTEQASTSGTSIDFTSIPAWAREIIITFIGVSTNGTSPLLIQLGDSGGIETSGYLGASSDIVGAAAANYTTGFGISTAWGAANLAHGTITLCMENATANTWAAQGAISLSNAAQTFITAGSKSTSAALDRLRITTLGGVNTFDAGAINILYK